MSAARKYSSAAVVLPSSPPSKRRGTTVKSMRTIDGYMKKMRAFITCATLPREPSCWRVAARTRRARSDDHRRRARRLQEQRVVPRPAEAREDTRGGDRPDRIEVHERVHVAHDDLVLVGPIDLEAEAENPEDLQKSDGEAHLHLQRVCVALLDPRRHLGRPPRAGGRQPSWRLRALQSSGSALRRRMRHRRRPASSASASCAPSTRRRRRRRRRRRGRSDDHGDAAPRTSSVHCSQIPLYMLHPASHAAHSGPRWPVRQPSPSTPARTGEFGQVPYRGQR